MGEWGNEGWEIKLAPPTPLKKESNEQTFLGRVLPHPDNDGKYIILPTSNVGNLELYTTAGVQSWTVAFTDITVECDKWTGVFWLDTTDNAIWVWAYDVGATPDAYHLAKVALANGAVTNIGTCYPGDGLFSGGFNQFFVERAAMGSGNLTIRDGDYKIILNTADGSIATAAAQISQNGKTIPAGVGYETTDGVIYVGNFAYYTNGSIYGYLLRGGVHKKVILLNNSPCSSTISSNPMLWGGYVAMKCLSTSTMYNGRFFNRTEFDAWLVRIADYYGLPT